MNAGRGHRIDETPGFRSVEPLRGVTSIPPAEYVNAKGWGFALSGQGLSLLASDLVGLGQVIDGFGVLVARTVSDHGIQRSQESSTHGGVGDGLDAAALFEDSLSDSLLSSVVFGQASGGTAQGPSQGGGAGLGDVSGSGFASGGLVVGGEPGPEFEGVGVGKSSEVSDLGDDDAGPDLIDAGDALDDGHDGLEAFGAVGLDDLAAEHFPLAFDELDQIDEVFGGLVGNVLEPMPMGEQPLLGGGAVQLGTGQIGRQQDEPQRGFDPGQGPAQLTPVTAELSQPQDVLVGDPAKGTVPAGQTDRDVLGVVGIVLSAFAAPAGQFRSVGNVQPVDIVAIFVDKPFDEPAGLDRHPRGPGQR